MTHRILGERGRTLEEEFFRRQKAVLVERRRVEAQQLTARVALTAATGIRDDLLLDRLVAMGISADTLVALSLVPLAEVAWADGRLDSEEKLAIMKAASSAGLDEGGPGRRLVERCLAERPPAVLLELWRNYIESVCTELPESARKGLQRELLRQARVVAEATGGFGGILSRVSAHEEALLQEIARAFDA